MDLIAFDHFIISISIGRAEARVAAESHENRGAKELDSSAINL
jgi:hypothetical protein